MTMLFMLFQDLPAGPTQFLQESQARATTWFEALTNGAVLVTLFDILIKISGAVFALLVGRWLIGYAVTIVDRAMKNQKIDATLIRYTVSSLTVLLNMALIIAILGFFGFETTTFAALLAGAGLAVGAAWGGLLANFAAGAFLVMLRPFKVGDRIEAGGVVGRVTEIGMFVTTIKTDDNVINFVGNNKIFSDNIQNYSESRYRRVESRVQLGYDVDIVRAIEMLKQKLSAVENVMVNPGPEVQVIRINRIGPLLQVAPACEPAFYDQVLSDTNLTIIETLRRAGITSPVQNISVHMEEGNGLQERPN